jgi:hypothetical protein
VRRYGGQVFLVDDKGVAFRSGVLADPRGMGFWSMSGVATLTAMSPKKRDGGKRLSGNPQRREQQIASRSLTKTGKPDTSSWARELSIEDRRAFGDLARRLAGWAPAMPWWAQSHDRVIKSFLDEPVPERPVDVETRACIAVGDEFYARLSSGDTGLAPAQWLRALVEETGCRLQAAIASGADDWRPLLALLGGLAGIAPEHEASPDFPDIKFPRETAAACLSAAAKSLADSGLSAAVPAPDEEDGWVPGEALVAQDAYGSRFLLAVPFSSGEAPGDGDHWYAWDVDACWLVTVVGAGVFGSAEDALTEWRDAVGMTAAGARLSPCPGELAAWLLGPPARSGLLGDMLAGGEHRELIREYFRSGRRAQMVLASLPGDGQEADPVFAAEIDTAPFVDWYAGQHADAPKPGKFRKQAAETAGFLLDAWGPHEHPAKETVYSCSPHRIEMLGRLVRDDYLPKEGNAVLALLPDWVQWCAGRAGLPAALAEPALEAARAEAATLVTDDHGPGDEDGARAPFRRKEL